MARKGRVSFSNVQRRQLIRPPPNANWGGRRKSRKGGETNLASSAYKQCADPSCRSGSACHDGGAKAEASRVEPLEARRCQRLLTNDPSESLGGVADGVSEGANSLRDLASHVKQECVSGPAGSWPAGNQSVPEAGSQDLAGSNGGGCLHPAPAPQIRWRDGNQTATGSMVSEKGVPDCCGKLDLTHYEPCRQKLGARCSLDGTFTDPSMPHGNNVRIYIILQDATHLQREAWTE